MNPIHVMNNAELNGLLEQLIADWESEVVEFKEAKEDFDTDKIGRYFSALSNEANLRGKNGAWLIFGVNDKKRCVVGSNYRIKKEHLHFLKGQMEIIRTRVCV